MSELIQWPRAKYWEKAWNPVVGCRPCSPACENCWAREWMARFPQYLGSFEPTETRSSWRPPSSGVVFCGNLSDLFGEWCDSRQFAGPEFWVGRTLGRPKATYLWLTKRAARMAETLLHGIVQLEDGSFERFDGCEMGNQWFGFTAEDQERYNQRFEDFRLGRWANWWISVEPLLGPISLGLMGISPKQRPGWVVVGCESGAHRRPCKVAWVESVVEQCWFADVPVFVKQLDLGGRCVTDIEKFPEHLRVRQVPWAVRQGEKG